MKFLISNNPSSLRKELELYLYSATVEAEYGDEVVGGTVVTMAHHGPRTGNMAPSEHCWDHKFANVEIVGLSHFDLDTLGGCMVLMGCFPDDRRFEKFWAAAVYVDLHGPHMLKEFLLNCGSPCVVREDLSDLFNTFWAWSEKNRLFPPRNGSVEEVTEFVEKAVGVLLRILHGDETLLQKGREWKEEKENLNHASFVKVEGGVILRQSSEFVNHLYDTPDGVVSRAVVGFNSERKSITVSFADGDNCPSAVSIVQSLWGTEAGGHGGIAGSPRAQEMEQEDALRAFEATKAALKK